MSFWDWFKEPKKIEAPIYCVPAAIAAAWAWQVGQKTESRMAVTNIRKGVDHVQAQGLVDGEWQYLVIVNTAGGLMARVGKPHFDIEPYRYVGLEEWVDDQIEYAEVH